LQRQILDVVAEDTSVQNYREIAEQLGVGRETVKNAIFDLTRKR
jgi:DNA-binding Lrp family transcriptional regulator